MIAWGQQQYRMRVLSWQSLPVLLQAGRCQARSQTPFSPSPRCFNQKYMACFCLAGCPQPQGCLFARRAPALPCPLQPREPVPSSKAQTSERKRPKSSARFDSSPSLGCCRKVGSHCLGSLGKSLCYLFDHGEFFLIFNLIFAYWS